MTATDVPTALILAGGSGERLGRGPKALLQLDGRSLLQRAVDVVRDSCGEIVVALPPALLEAGEREVGGVARVIPGGESRLGTFRLLLQAAGSAPTILLHDVVHPLTPRLLVKRVVEAARLGGSAVAVNRVHDFALGADGSVHARPGQSFVQVKPLAFRLDAMMRGLEAHDAGRSLASARQHAAGTDPGVVELLQLAGETPELVESESWNIKLTTESDWHMIQALSNAAS